MVYYSNKALSLIILRRFEEAFVVVEKALKKYKYTKSEPRKLAVLLSRKARIYEL